MTGDARPGAIVETRAYDDAGGRKRLSLAIRSDLTIEAQVSSPGATWIDRQLLAKQSALNTGGSIISSTRVWPGGKVRELFSLAIFSTRYADASSTGPLPNCRTTRGSPIAHPPKASTSPACIVSASRSRRGGSQ